MRQALILILVLINCETFASAQDKPQKYALLAAVREYEHPDMNQPLLAFPEVDAKSMNDLLKESGYEVDLLLGKQATQASIQKKLAGFAEKGSNKGVVLVGLFGHGVEFESTKKSYFCPYNTSIKAKRDAQGRPLSNDNGQPRMEPDSEKLISIDDILLALRESKASNRILLADCCRNDPNAARGRSFGTSLEINQLPQNTAVMFACSAQEKAFEHKDWGHGAFTKCLLDSIRENTARGKSLMGSIAEDVEPAVEKLVASKVDATQTPRLLSTGARVDLQLTLLSTSKPSTTPLSSTKPSKPLEPTTPPSSTPSQPAKPKPSEPPKTDVTSSRGFEGTKAGDKKELSGIAFRWCPPGTFTMGSPKTELKRHDNEDQVSVSLTSGFWLGETEFTQGQWQKLKGTTPWKGQQYAKEGDDYAASYIRHDDAVALCNNLTSEERSAGRLPKGWKYSLPTEAQWEYACRAGTTTTYSFGEDESQLSQYGWWGGIVGNGNGNALTEQYAHKVGQKKSNPWGLKDMHGNVWEWCSDFYGEKLPGGRNPLGANSGSYRVFRGGCWSSPAVDCRPAFRNSFLPGALRNFLGFRLAIVPE